MPTYRVGCPVPASLRDDGRLPSEVVYDLTTGHAGALRALLGDGWTRHDGSLDHRLPAPGEQIRRGVFVRFGYAGDVDELGDLPAVLPVLVEVTAYEHTTFPVTSPRALGVMMAWTLALVLGAGALARVGADSTALAISSGLATFIAAIAAMLRARGWLELLRWRRTPPRPPLARWPATYTSLQLLAATLATATLVGVPLWVFDHTGLAVVAQLALLLLLLLTARAPVITTQPSPATLAENAAASAIVEGYLHDPRHGFTPLPLDPDAR